MASRAGIKQNRSNAPRSSAGNNGDNKDNKNKRRPDGTPDKTKASTPSCEVMQDEGEISRRTIINDEILALQIKEEDLLKLREPKPPAERKCSPTYNTVLIRRPKVMRTASDLLAGKCVTVMRPAPREAPVKSPDLTKLAGARFDDSGNIIPHSILGDVDDFVNQAIQTGDLTEKPAVLTPRSSECLTAIDVPKKACKCYPHYCSADESNALKNWDAKMMERRRQQNYLSCVLNKPIDQLVMNQAENYRKIEELRCLIDRTLPFVENGKGHARGAEFWTLPQNFGGELTGLHSTLTETEKGYPPAIMHVGVPKAVIREKGLDIEPTPLWFRKPWHRSEYLANRICQLAPLMNQLDPHEPETIDLEVVGITKPNVTTSCEKMNSEQDANGTDQSVDATASLQDPVEDHPDVCTEAVFGPSIRFNGLRLQWTGDSFSHCAEVASEARVSFEALTCERTTSYLDIGNDGTTSIYFSWKRVPSANPFNVISARIQRFYFNQNNGVLLPGDNLKFPFVFKSPNAGVFSEQWEFQTHPVVAGGAKLVTTLRGVALKQDKFELNRAQVEQELQDKQDHEISKCIVDDLVAGIRTPERSHSPIDAYITDEEIFKRLNPELNFSNDHIEQLKGLYEMALPDEEKGRPWNMNVLAIRQTIAFLPDEDDLKQDLLRQLNGIVSSLSFQAFAPVCSMTYNIGYSIMCDAVDQFVERDVSLRLLVGLPSRTSSTRITPSHSTARVRNHTSAVPLETIHSDQDDDAPGTTPSQLAETKIQKSKEKKTSKEGKLSPAKKKKVPTATLR